MSTIGWGIIGCGHVCEIKSGPALMRARNSRIVAVMRRDAVAARDYAQRFGVPASYDHAEALLADPNVDAVYIAAPPRYHHPYVLMAAAAGKPVLVEKPMAMNASEAEQMVTACEAAHVPLFVNYFRRALPRFVEIKNRLADGAIGEVRTVTLAFSTPGLTSEAGSDGWRLRPDRGGNPFFDTACHHLDLLDFLLGPIADVRWHSTRQSLNSPANDLYTASLRFESGIQAAADWCYSAGITTDLMEIVGSNGVIAFPVFDLEAPILIESENDAEQLTVVPEPFVHLPFMQCVVDALNDEGECPSTGRSALRTARIVDYILQGRT